MTKSVCVCVCAFVSVYECVCLCVYSCVCVCVCVTLTGYRRTSVMTNDVTRMCAHAHYIPTNVLECVCLCGCVCVCVCLCVCHSSWRISYQLQKKVHQKHSKKKKITCNITNMLRIQDICRMLVMVITNWYVQQILCPTSYEYFRTNRIGQALWWICY